MGDMTPEQETIWLAILTWLKLGIDGGETAINALSDGIAAFMNTASKEDMLFAIATLVMTPAEILKQLNISPDEFETHLVDPMSMHILNWSYKE